MTVFLEMMPICFPQQVNGPEEEVGEAGLGFDPEKCYWKTIREQVMDCRGLHQVDNQDP